MKTRKLVYSVAIALVLGSVQSLFAQSRTNNAADPTPAQVLCCTEAPDGTITCTERVCPTDVVESNCCPDQANVKGGGRITGTIKLTAQQATILKSGGEVNVEGKIISTKVKRVKIVKQGSW